MGNYWEIGKHSKENKFDRARMLIYVFENTEKIVDN